MNAPAESTPAEWALRKAIELLDEFVLAQDRKARVLAIALAIEAAANAATERERERLEGWCHEARNDVLCCIDLNADEERGATIWLDNFAAAIRKGGDND